MHAQRLGKFHLCPQQLLIEKWRTREIRCAIDQDVAKYGLRLAGMLKEVEFEGQNVSRDSRREVEIYTVELPDSAFIYPFSRLSLLAVRLPAWKKSWVNGLMSGIREGRSRFNVHQ